jgi:hypothetical protein
VEQTKLQVGVGKISVFLFTFIIVSDDDQACEVTDGSLDVSTLTVDISELTMSLLLLLL